MLRDRYDMSLGIGLARLKGWMLRIGHLGALNDLTLIGTPGPDAARHAGRGRNGAARWRGPHRQGGVAAAMAVLDGGDAANKAKAASQILRQLRAPRLAPAGEQDAGSQTDADRRGGRSSYPIGEMLEASFRQTRRVDQRRDKLLINKEPCRRIWLRMRERGASVHGDPCG
jgi:hypothetical protein